MKDTYKGVVTSVRISTSKFPIPIGLHQGSSLSPYLFALVMDDLTKLIPKEVPWWILFANNIVFVDGTISGVDAKLKI